MKFLGDYIQGTDVPSIPEYFTGKTVFITGGTGFIGQVLVYKLLYSCEGLDRIYLLMRSKRGVNIQERLNKLYSSSCFDRLKNEKPGVFEAKVFVIRGDISELGLGLSDTDRSTLQNSVNVVFNIAASIRFDDPLRKAVNLNLRGTREMIQLAKEMKKLEAFVHVSTVFCNCNEPVIEEKLYPALVDWKNLICVCEQNDDAAVSLLENQFLQTYPNTYVFTKQLAEQVVAEQQGILPVVISRPSVVVGSFKEPMPGWTEKYHGLNGLMIGLAKGVVRVTLADPDNRLNMVYVDFCARQFIVSAWARGVKPISQSDEVPVYNACAKREHEMAIGTLSHNFVKIAIKQPSHSTFGMPTSTITTSLRVYYVLFFFLQLLPALLVDALVWIARRKTFFTNLQRQIFLGTLAFAKFGNNRVLTFKNDQLVQLQSYMKASDIEDFMYYGADYDVLESIGVTWVGIKKYFLKEEPADQPAANKRMERLVIMHKTVKYIVTAFIIWKIYVFASKLFLLQ